MKTYHKIQTVFKRDPETKFRTLLEGDYSTPEIEYLAGLEWEWTEKVDGTNIRIMWDGEAVRFGGKTDRAQIPATLYDALARLFPAAYMGNVFGGDGGVCLYGEGYGPKIQKGGGNYRKDQSFVLFDVRIGDAWLRRGSVNDIASDIGIDFVPTIGAGTLPEMVEMVRAGFNSTWGDFRSEGIVARPAVALVDRMGHRVITKLKCKDFGARP